MATADTDQKIISINPRIYCYRSLDNTEVVLARKVRTVLPPGFPTALATGQTWDPSDFTNEGRYIFFLSEYDKFELDNALSSFKALCLDGNLVNSSNFPLPQLQHTLRSLANDLHDGKGFCVIRGLEPDRYCVEDSTIVFLGIQSYIAERRMRQDEAGNMLVHVFSNPLNERLSNHVRHSTGDVPFHTDPDADILAFQTRSTASSGGRCILSSGHTIYNELAKSRPDVICTLARPDWPFALPYFYQRPILFQHNARTIFCFTRVALIGSRFYPRPSSIPSISPRQHEALDLLNSVAEKNRLDITLKAGDIHFVNNLALLHRRDNFIDDETNKRHLVRMHLRNEQLGWGIPKQLQRFWNDALDDDKDERWHVEPMPEDFFPLRLGSH